MLTTRPDILMTAYIKQINNSQFEHWILKTPCFNAQQLAGYITPEAESSKLTANFKRDILAEFDRRIPSLNSSVQQQYPQFLIKSFFFCVEYQSQADQEFKLPLTLLDDLISSPYFNLKTTLDDKSQQMPLHAVVQRKKQNNEIYQYALDVLLKHTDISSAINLPDKTPKKATPLSYAIENHDIETLKHLAKQNAYHNASVEELVTYSRTFNENDFPLVLKSNSFVTNIQELDYITTAANHGHLHFLLGLHQIGINIDSAIKKYGEIDYIKKLAPYEQQLEWMHEGQDKLAQGILSKEPEEFTQTLHILDDFHSKIEHKDFQRKYPLSLFAMVKECIQDEKKSAYIEPLLQSPYFNRDLQTKLLFQTAISVKDPKDDFPLQQLMASSVYQNISVENPLLYKGKPFLQDVINECIKNNNGAPCVALFKNPKIKKLIEIPDEKGVYFMDSFIKDTNLLPHLKLLIAFGAKNRCSYEIVRKMYNERTLPQFNYILYSFADINKPLPDGLTLAEHAIFNSNYSILSLLFHRGAHIHRGLALCGIKGIYNLTNHLFEKNKYSYELRLNEELNKYIKHTKLLTIHFCDVVIDILKTSTEQQRNALKVITQRNYSFKERLFKFIKCKCLSEETQAYIFKESFVEGTGLYTIWNTARGLKKPTIYSGMLEKVYKSNQFYKNHKQNTVEQAIAEILDYKKRLARKNDSTDLLELLDKKNEFSAPAKYEINSLLPIELAIVDNKPEEIFELFNPLKDYFITAYDKDYKTYPLRYTLALSGKKRLKSFMKKMLNKKGSQAVPLHNNLQIALDKLKDHFEILYQDILIEKIPPKVVKKIAEKFPEFPQRMLDHARLKGIEKEYEVLKHILTAPSAVSFFWEGPQCRRERTVLYEKMKELNEEIETKEKKLSFETGKYFLNDPIRNKLYMQFKVLLKKYDALSNKNGFAEQKHQQDKIDICHFAIDILEKGCVPENILSELPDGNVLKLWDYLEKKYKAYNVFKGDFFFFLDNHLAFGLKDLIAYQHNIMTNIPASDICVANVSLVSTPLSTLESLPEPSAPREVLTDTEIESTMPNQNLTVADIQLTQSHDNEQKTIISETGHIFNREQRIHTLEPDFISNQAQKTNTSELSPTLHQEQKTIILESCNISNQVPKNLLSESGPISFFSTNKKESTVNNNSFSLKKKNDLTLETALPEKGKHKRILLV
ncbi:MAG: hypothetical protein JO131_01545 [Gammaproteobacteria bacterium]|nr:hypothetical protein [Gammaproteobacteria bacterium]